MGALCCVVAVGPLLTKSPGTAGRRDMNSDDDLHWRTNLSYSPAHDSTWDLDNEPHLTSPSGRNRHCKESSSMAAGLQQSPDSSASRGSRSNTFQFHPSNEEQDDDHDQTAISSSINSSCSPMNPQLSYTTKERNKLSQSLQKEASLDQSTTSSSREEMELNIETLDAAESRNQEHSRGSITHQRCGVCNRLLSQRSPWSSCKIMRNGDMPSVSVLPCCHIYHVECLDQVTPKAQTREPPCPICSKGIETMEEPLVVPETLQMALRSLRRSHGGVGSESMSSIINNNNRSNARRKPRQTRFRCCLNIKFLSSSTNR